MRVSTALILASAWLLATAPQVAADAEWKKHTYEADKFEILFPGPVEVSPQELDDEMRALIEDGTDYLSDEPRRLFMVTVTRTKEGVTGLRAPAEAMMSSLNCQVTSRNAEVQISGQVGREYGGSKCDLGRSVLMRAVTRGPRMYQIIGFVTDDADLAMAERFVSSFALLPE